MNDLAGLLDPCRMIARQAADRILEIYGTEFDVEAKDDDSPLTAADLASHRAIIAGLRQLTPDLPIMSEESALIPFEERRQWSRYWLIDPLDGTKEFVKRNGEFTVNIALVDGHQPVLGVVHVPVTGVCYFGARGVGAFKADGTADATPIEVSGRSSDPVKIVGSRSHAGGRTADFVAAVGDHELVSIGSSLKLCLVAEGAADVYPRLGPTCEWDTAAAQAVVECAGGEVVDTAGRPLRCNTGEAVLNPEFVVVGADDRDWLSCVPD